jgi:hydroxyethylthiazole kinase-like uncharacterized protein yjeF
MKVVTAEQMRALDKRATEEYGIPGVVLMENAGRAVVDVMQRELGPLEGRRVAVFCGGGNNGGDGAVIARYLRLLGARPEVSMVGSYDRLSDDARAHFNVLQSLEIAINGFGYDDPPRPLVEEFGWQVDIVVDAMLGTGAKGAPREGYATAIASINKTACSVIAVDIPSGMDADTGATPGEVIRATHTVTFAYPKLGQFLFPGAACVGKLHVVDIGFDWDKLDPETPFRLFTLPGTSHENAPRRASSLGDAAHLLQKRDPDANKGDYGHVAIIAGSRGMCGAPALVARAAQHAGAGLVTVLSPQSAQTVIAGKLDEQMTLALPEEDGAVSAAAFDQIAAFAQKATVLCVGPGLTTHPGTVALVQRLIAEIDKPLVLDADGLNALALQPDIIAKRAANPHAPLILTPHPGEAARLLNTSIEAIQADRIAAVRELAARYHAIALLKGRYTLIADVDGDIIINTTGNPGMATGGAGDTLTGIIGGLLAQNTRWWDKRVKENDKATGAENTKQRDKQRQPENRMAADGHAETRSMTKTVALAAYVHGAAADMAIEKTGEAGLVAGDIIAYLGRALRQLEEAR